MRAAQTTILGELRLSLASGERIDLPEPAGTFTMPVDIVAESDGQGGAALRMDWASLRRNVSDCLRRLAAEIEPMDDHPAVTEARAGRVVVIRLDTLEASERALADIADHVDLPGTTYTRTNGQLRLDFPSGGRIMAPARPVQADTVMVDRTAFEPSDLDQIGSVLPMLRHAYAARILAI